MEVTTTTVGSDQTRQEWRQNVLVHAPLRCLGG
jgi:hypothetical protein